MTVFWYDNAQLTITPKDDYNKMRQRMVAVTFSGAVTVRPDGMPAGAPALMALRLAFIQNGSFNRTYTYAMPFAVWARSLAVNQRHIPPTFSYNGAGTEAITLPTRLDMVDGSISPVYNSKGRAMKHPAGSPLVANIHSSDTPLAGSLPPARVLIPGKSVNSNPPQGSFIVWPQTRVVLADNFQTWLVVTHAGGNGQLPAGAPYTALLVGGWQLNVDSNNTGTPQRATLAPPNPAAPPVAPPSTTGTPANVALRALQNYQWTGPTLTGPQNNTTLP